MECGTRDERAELMTGRSAGGRSVFRAGFCLPFSAAHFIILIPGFAFSLSPDSRVSVNSWPGGESIPLISSPCTPVSPRKITGNGSRLGGRRRTPVGVRRPGFPSTSRRGTKAGRRTCQVRARNARKRGQTRIPPPIPMLTPESPDLSPHFRDAMITSLTVVRERIGPGRTGGCSGPRPKYGARFGEGDWQRVSRWRAGGFSRAVADQPPGAGLFVCASGQRGGRSGPVARTMP